jgi:hypothetical protein
MRLFEAFSPCCEARGTAMICGIRSFAIAKYQILRVRARLCPAEAGKVAFADPGSTLDRDAMLPLLFSRARKYRWLNYDGVRYDNREFKRYRSRINPSSWKCSTFRVIPQTASVFPFQGHSAYPFLNSRRVDLIERRFTGTFTPRDG